jgi:hypothetical protein
MALCCDRRMRMPVSAQLIKQLRCVALVSEDKII